MSEADEMTTTGAAARLPAPASHLHLEPVVNEMVGVAAIAAHVLEAIRANPNECSDLLLEEGLGWLQARLNAAAENLPAVQTQRRPRWFTTMEADMVREALDAIPRPEDAGQAADTNAAVFKLMMAAPASADQS